MAGQINVEISNFEEQNFCRLCMSSVFGLRPLIPKEPTETDMMAKIRSLTEVTIVPSEEQNARICSRCVQQLEGFDLFRRRCMDSDRVIRRIRACRQQLQRTDNSSPSGVPAKQSIVGAQHPVASGSVPPITGERFGGMFNLLEYCEDGVLPGEYRVLYSGYVYRRKTLMVWQCEQTTCPCLLLVMKQDFSNFSVNGTHNHGQVPSSNEKRKFTKMNNLVCAFLNDLRRPKDPPAVPNVVPGGQSAIDRPHGSPAIVPQLSHVSPVSQPKPIALIFRNGQTLTVRQGLAQVRQVSDIRERYPIGLVSQTPRPSRSLGLNQLGAAQDTQGNATLSPLYNPGAGISAGNALELISAKPLTRTSNTVTMTNTQASQSVISSLQSSTATSLDQTVQQLMQQMKAIVEKAKESLPKELPVKSTDKSNPGSATKSTECSKPSTIAAGKSATAALPGTSTTSGVTNAIQTTQKEKETGSAKRQEHLPPVPLEISDTNPIPLENSNPEVAVQPTTPGQASKAKEQESSVSRKPAEEPASKRKTRSADVAKRNKKFKA